MYPFAQNGKAQFIDAIFIYEMIFKGEFRCENKGFVMESPAELR